jgi:hypothetical protein
MRARFHSKYLLYGTVHENTPPNRIRQYKSLSETRLSPYLWSHYTYFQVYKQVAAVGNRPQWKYFNVCAFQTERPVGTTPDVENSHKNATPAAK